MRITCSPGFPGSMIGSIDLQPLKYYSAPSSKSQITDHVDPELVTIPYVEDPEFGSHFDAMKVMKGTYKDEMHVSYDVEFTIDVDKKGYITQFEHTFQLERYLDLIRTQSYKVIKTNWRGQSFHVMTYSYLEEVEFPAGLFFFEEYFLVCNMTYGY